MIKNMKKLAGSYEYNIMVLLTAFFSYTFFLNHIAIGVDTLCADRYVNKLYSIYQGRYLVWWIWYIISRGGQKYSFFSFDALGILLIVVGGMLISAILLELLHDFDEKAAIRACAIFSCLYISYPLVCEGFVYNGMAMAVGMGEICCTLAWYVIYESYMGKNRCIQKKLVGCILLMVACITYEAALPIYVMLFFLFQILKLKEKLKFKDICKQCIDFSAPLFIGVGLRLVLDKMVQFILPVNTISGAVADNQMFAGYQKQDALINLIENCVVKYGIMGIWYFPITVFVISILVVVLLICIDLRKRRGIWRVLFAYGGLLVSVFMISLIKGDYAPYRTCFVFGGLVGCSFALLYLMICKCRYNVVITLYCLGVLVLVICQINEMNYWFDLNYQRWEQEKETINQVGNYLAANDEGKPVVFVGEYCLSEEIYIQLRVPDNDYFYEKINSKYMELTNRELLKTTKKVETSVKSVIDWGVDAFGEGNTELIKLFRYCGYKVRRGTEEMYQEALDYKDEMPSWPQEGCMKDMGEYFIFKW